MELSNLRPAEESKTVDIKEEPIKDTKPQNKIISGDLNSVKTTIKEIENEIKDAGFSIETEDYSDNYKADQVMRQDVAEGEVVDRFRVCVCGGRHHDGAFGGCRFGFGGDVAAYEGKPRELRLCRGQCRDVGSLQFHYPRDESGRQSRGAHFLVQYSVLFPFVDIGSRGTRTRGRRGNYGARDCRRGDGACVRVVDGRCDEREHDRDGGGELLYAGTLLRFLRALFRSGSVA